MHVVCLVAVLIGAASDRHGGMAAHDAHNASRMVGYFTGWSAATYGAAGLERVAHKLTHVNYAFARFDESGIVAPLTASDCANGTWSGCSAAAGNGTLDHVAAVRDRQAGRLATFISFGGWTWGALRSCRFFSAMANSSTTRARFVGQAVGFARAMALDGIDIDWEEPGSTDAACGGTPPALDVDNFHALLRELHAAAKAEGKATARPPLSLSVATPAGVVPARAMKLHRVAHLLSHINVMAYDMHGAWDKATGENAPLYDQVLGDLNSVNTTLAAYTAPLGGGGGGGGSGSGSGGEGGWGGLGLDPAQLALGLGAYAHQFFVPLNSSAPPPGAVPRHVPIGALSLGNGSTVPYSTVVARANTMRSYYDMAVEAPTAWGAADYDGVVEWLGFDNERSVRAKLDLARAYGVRSAMLWSLDQDDVAHGSPLLTAAWKHL